MKYRNGLPFILNQRRRLALCPEDDYPWLRWRSVDTARFEYITAVCTTRSFAAFGGGMPLAEAAGQLSQWSREGLLVHRRMRGFEARRWCGWKLAASRWPPERLSGDCERRLTA